MNRPETDDILYRLIDAPDTLTDADIAIIESDPELRELYRTAVLAKASVQTPPEVDVDREWQLFAAKIGTPVEQPLHRTSPVKPVPYRRYIAVAATLLLMIGIGVNLFRNDRVEEQSSTITEVPVNPAPADEPKPRLAEETTTDTAVEVNPKPNISYRPTAARMPAKAAPVRSQAHDRAVPEMPSAPAFAETEPDLTPEQIMAIQQARIDERIATARAEQYRAAYAAMMRSRGLDPEPQPTQATYYNEAPRQGNFMRVVMP